MTTPLKNKDHINMDVHGAYQNKDIDASREAHENRHLHSEDKHMPEGGYIKTIQLGGLDGCLTCFAIVASATGGGLPWQSVLAIGFANIFADAMSMGVGEFLSEKAEVEYVLQEKEREEFELEQYPQGEKEEMVELYTDKGMSREDATAVVDVLVKYEPFFIEIMMNQELELQLPEEDWKVENFKSGIVMFLSFCAFGVIPLLGYIILPIADPASSGVAGANLLFAFAFIVTGLSLFLMGMVKSKFGTTSWWYNGLETMILGLVCASIAYGVGLAVKQAFGMSTL